jgi:hypothetical protein
MIFKRIKKNKRETYWIFSSVLPEAKKFPPMASDLMHPI